MTSLKESSPSDAIGYFYLSFSVSLSFSLSVITPLRDPERDAYDPEAFTLQQEGEGEGEHQWEPITKYLSFNGEQQKWLGNPFVPFPLKGTVPFPLVV